MAIGVLLIAHPGFGKALLQAAQHINGVNSLTVLTHDIQTELDANAQLIAASAAFRKVENPSGVLILVDSPGGIADKTASQLAQFGTPVKRVSGLSLPMLLRVMHYAEQDLDELARTAAAGGRNGVVIDHA
ncbi:MAG: PTS fructose IIA subunit family protein [Arenimonas sp.]